ncbi:MAG: hypothetical protein M9894_02745 [Planctomycetes bacterium]|nr:hypothetical protein [Planctomycetota bacterium]
MAEHEAEVRDPCDETGPIPPLPHGELDRDDDLHDSGEGEVDEPDEEDLGDELVAELEASHVADPPADPVLTDARVLADEVQPPPAGSTARVDPLAETADPDAPTARVAPAPPASGVDRRAVTAREPALDDEPPPSPAARASSGRPPPPPRPAPRAAPLALALGAALPVLALAALALAGAPQALLHRWSERDGFEPNDRLEQAAPLPLGRTDGLSCGPTDVDWFRLEVPAGRALVVEVGASSGRVGGGAALHASDGRRLAATAARGGAERLVSPPAGAAPEAVLLVVWGGLGPYHVEARAVDPPGRFEPNGRPEDAAPLAPGRAAGVGCDGEDWFSVPVPAHHRARARLVAAPPGLTVAWGWTGEAAAAATAPAVALDRHALLRVSGAAGAYDLDVTLEPAPVPAPPGEPPRLEPGLYPRLVSAGSDTWRLEVPAGHVLEVEARGPDRWGPHLAVLDDAWTPLKADLAFLQGGSRLTFEAEAVVDALLQVGGAPGEYALSVALRPRAPAAVTPAAGWPPTEDATPLRPGERREEVWGEAWYVLHADPGQVVSLRVEAAPSAELTARLFEGPGRASAPVAGVQGQLTLEHVAAGDGPLYLHLSTHQALARCTLTLALDGVAGPPTLAPGRHVGLRCRGEALFLLVVPGGRRVVVEARFRSAEGDLDLELLDAGGQVVAASDSLDDVERVAYAPPTDEQLTLRVHNAANRFDLEVRLEEP